MSFIQLEGLTFDHFDVDIENGGEMIDGRLGGMGDFGSETPIGGEIPPDPDLRRIDSGKEGWNPGSGKTGRIQTGSKNRF